MSRKLGLSKDGGRVETYEKKKTVLKVLKKKTGGQIPLYL